WDRIVNAESEGARGKSNHLSEKTQAALRLFKILQQLDRTITPAPAKTAMKNRTSRRHRPSSFLDPGCVNQHRSIEKARVCARLLPFGFAENLNASTAA